MEKRKNLILFTGNSSASLRKNLSTWIEAFVSKYGDSNVARIRAGETDPSQVASELLSMPFFSEKRLAVFEGVPRQKGGRAAKSDDDSGSDSPVGESSGDPVSQIEAAVLSVFDAIPEWTFAIFVSEDPDKTSALYKKLLAEGDVKTFEALTGEGAEEFVRNRLPGISPAAARALVKRTEGDERRLRGAVEKLSLAYGDERIGEKEVDEAEEAGSDQKSFAVADAIVAGDVEKAVSTLRAVTEKDSPYAVFPAVVSTIRKTLQIETLRRSGSDDAAIMKALELKSAWELSKRPKLSEKSYRGISKAYASLVAFEADWRTGNAPGEDEAAALECAVVSAVLSLRKS